MERKPSNLCQVPSPKSVCKFSTFPPTKIPLWVRMMQVAAFAHWCYFSCTIARWCSIPLWMVMLLFIILFYFWNDWWISVWSCSSWRMSETL
jgi:hypothetical protein